MTVAGETIYIVPAAHDAAAVWRNSSTISMDPISVKMYTWIGVSEANRSALFSTHAHAQYNEGNQKPLTPTRMMIELHHRQVHPGEKYDHHFRGKTLPALLHDMDLHRENNLAVLDRSGNFIKISLLKLCMQVFIKGQTDAFLGQAIWKADQDLLSWFMIWEHTNWKYLFQPPEFLSGDMLKAKQKLIGAFAKYLSMPRDERQDAGYFAQATEDMLREVGLSDREIGGILMLHYWA
jgi:cholesterol 7alpha-monooxygenase